MPVTTLSMKFKFPQFKELDDSILQMAIDEASLGISNKWIASQKDLAQLYLAAHFLMVAEAATAIYEERGRQVVSERIGQLSTTYQANASSTPPGDLKTTAAGARFLELCRGSFPGIAVV